MNMEITIPEFFNIKHYKALTHLSSLDDTEQMVHTISVITNQPREEVMRWSISSIVDVYKAINDMLSDALPSFHPIIEWNGVLYGYQPMSKMTLGEYIDIDGLIKDIDKNISAILALLYRPLTKNKIKESTYIFKSTIKAMKYDVENVFDYYDVEDYDIDKHKQQTLEFEKFPIDIALGAMGFFLDIKTTLLNDSQIYFLNPHVALTLKPNKRKPRLASIMDGFSLSTSLLKPISYQSMETNV